jgi:hypothetical protein
MAMVMCKSCHKRRNHAKLVVVVVPQIKWNKQHFQQTQLTGCIKSEGSSLKVFNE